MGLLTHYSDVIEAGCDEAGRGCLAGPVVAGAVILRKGADFPELNDSKKLAEKKRMELREMIMHEALAYGVGIVTAAEIDEINILNASFLAMHRALDKLVVRPEFLLILQDFLWKMLTFMETTKHVLISNSLWKKVSAILFAIIFSSLK